MYRSPCLQQLHTPLLQEDADVAVLEEMNRALGKLRRLVAG